MHEFVAKPSDKLEVLDWVATCSESLSTEASQERIEPGDNLHTLDRTDFIQNSGCMALARISEFGEAFVAAVSRSCKVPVEGSAQGAVRTTA